MAVPKIKYDIEAAVTGAADATKLAGELRGLGDVLEGPLQKSARDAAAALEALGAKQRALEAFGALKRETTQLSTALGAATAVVDRLGAELPQAAASTQAFATAERTASTAVQQSQAALASKRTELAQLRETVTGAARKTTEYKTSVDALKAGIKASAAEVQAQAAALRASIAATANAQNAEKALRGEYDLAIGSAAKLSGQVRAKNAALTESRAAMAGLGVSTANLAQTERTLQTAVDQVRTAVAGLAPAYQAAASASGASAQQQLQHHRTVRDGVSEIGTQLQKVQQIAMIAVGGGFLGGMIKDLAKTADEFKNLQARIKLATGEGAAFETAFKGVSEVALRTGSALGSTGTLFTKLAKAGVEAGKSLEVAQLEALGLTETISQSIQLSGGSAESAKAAVIQLIQGLQSGVLRGEEFNSVMEQAPRLAQAMSNGLGVTTGELRKLAGQGQLTADTVMKALQGQADVVAGEFAKLPNTVGVALQNLSTQWLMYVGAADNGMLSSSNAAKLIDGLSKNLDTLVTTLTVAGKIWGSLKIAALAADLALWGQRTIAATAAVEANTAATAVNTAGARANAAATTAMTAAQTAAAAALAAAAAAQGVGGAAAAGAAVQVGALAQAKQAALAAGRALATGVTATIGVLTGMTTAAGAAATAMRGLAAAKTAAATAGAAVMGMLGGPVGLLVLTGVFAKDIGELAAKLVLWAKGQDNVEQSAAKLAKAEDELRKKTEAATLAREKQRQSDLTAADARAGLTERSKALIAEFDKLIAKGDSAATAIASIGKDFDLSTQPGILNAISVLDKLVADGKLTAQQFSDAWTGSLKSVDLGEFETRFADTMTAMQRDAEYAARAVENAISSGITGEALVQLKAKAEGALQAIAKEAERTAQVVQATLAEAVRRTGLDMASISGGMSKASISAMSDINVIVQNLDGLRAKGIDTGNVLSISIGKAIDTANSQQAIDELKLRIESLREALGDKLTDGLLDQAKQKSMELKEALDKSLPGINSVTEAMRVLGVTSEAKLKQTAAIAKDAYATLLSSGTASTAEIAQAFQNMATKAIAANGGVADSAIKAEAALRGFKIEVDGVGKNTVRLASAADAASVAFAKASEAIRAKVAAMKAESSLMLSGLDLRKSQIDASIAIAQAQGNEAEVIRLKVAQKRIEIQIIQETVKAQIAEANASIAAAKAKMGELAANGSLTDSKRAELQAQVQVSEASINGAQARGQAVRVLEQEIKMLDAAISAHNQAVGAASAHATSVDGVARAYGSAGAAANSAASSFAAANAAAGGGTKTAAEQYKEGFDKAKEKADKTNNRKAGDTGGDGTTIPQFDTMEELDTWVEQWKADFREDNRKFIGSTEYIWYQRMMDQAHKKAAQALKSRQAVKAAGEKAKAAQDSAEKTQQAKTLPAKESSAPIQLPAQAPQKEWQSGGSASVGGNTYVSNVNIQGIGKAELKFADASSQQQTEGLLRALAQAKGVSQ